jgi:hypothetical protein
LERQHTPLLADERDIEIRTGRLGLPPWPEALEVLAELNRVLWVLAEDHRALVAEVHARFLGHGLAGDPTQPAAAPAIVACGIAA